MDADAIKKVTPKGFVIEPTLIVTHMNGDTECSPSVPDVANAFALYLTEGRADGDAEWLGDFDTAMDAKRAADACRIVAALTPL